MQTGSVWIQRSLRSSFVFHMCRAEQRGNRVQPLLLLVTQSNLFSKRHQSKQAEFGIRYWKSEVQHGIIICLQWVLDWQPEIVQLFLEIQLRGGLDQKFQISNHPLSYQDCVGVVTSVSLAVVTDLVLFVLMLYIFLEATSLRYMTKF